MPTIFPEGLSGSSGRQGRPSGKIDLSTPWIPDEPEYFAIGVDVVWLIEPEDRTIFVYSEITEMLRLKSDDILRGEGPLTGFEVPVGTIFTE